MTASTSTAASFVRGWAADFGRYDDDHTQYLLAEAAGHLANELRLRRPVAAAVTITPGNMTRYVIVATHLGPDGESALGGEILVALPINGGRRCAALALDQTSVWTPDYIADRFDLLPGDAIIVASVLTLAAAQL